MDGESRVGNAGAVVEVALRREVSRLRVWLRVLSAMEVGRGIVGVRPHRDTGRFAARDSDIGRVSPVEEGVIGKHDGRFVVITHKITMRVL